MSPQDQNNLPNPTEPSNNVGKAAEPPKGKKLIGGPTFTRNRVIFVMLSFALIGAYLLFRTFASPVITQSRLSRSLNNFVSNNPTTTTGTVNVQYKNSRDVKSVNLDYSLLFNPQNGNSRQYGTLKIDNQSFPYDFRYVDYQLFLKTGGLDKLPNLVPKDAWVYPYFSKRFGILRNNNNQWLVVGRQAGNNVSNVEGSYKCLTNFSPTLSQDDTNLLKNAWRKDPPLIYQKRPKAPKGLTKYRLVNNKKNRVDSFAEQVRNLNKVQQVKNCLNDTYASDAMDAALRAAANDKITLDVYVDKNDLIKQVDITADNSNSTTKVVLKFSYGKPAKIAKPANAKPAEDLLDRFINR